MEALLPTSPLYDFLEGRIQPASLTYVRLAQLTETEEKERINKEIGERRTRLGAKLNQVTTEVKCEAFASSGLESLFQNVIDWTQDDEARRTYEEKLFDRAYEHLSALPMAQKSEKQEQVMKMVHDMVIIKFPLELAWMLYLEWKDVASLDDLDKGVLREFIEFFPTTGISKLLQAHLGEVNDSKRSELPNGDSESEEAAWKEKTKSLNAEDRLILLTEGLEDSKDSAFGHRIASDFFRDIQEYETCVEVSRKGLSLLQQQAARTGFVFERNQDDLNLNLATSLIYLQAPKNHPEAKEVFDGVLKRKPTATDALLGLGLILEEQEDFQRASSFLDQASSRDPDNIRISTEAAWCKALNGDVQSGLDTLELSLQRLEKAPFRELRALTLYRIGKCIWDLRPDKASRRDRQGAYARFIASLKANPNFAPAYTSLGLYYANHSKDKKRARQCFQKAFELSATEVQAAEQLARAFADDSDWDIVGVIAQRVIDSGVARPAPGSKKKVLSWPFSALGIVQMTKQEYPKAVVSYQAALRIAPKDYYAWVGLGESYHSSGRYIAAEKTLEHARSLAPQTELDAPEDVWFAEYMLSNVFRELGEYDQAISGYHKVLQRRKNEFGLSIASLQTLVERAYHSIEIGFFGLAAESASAAIQSALDILVLQGKDQQTFNVWKAVADAIAVFSYVPGKLDCLPLEATTSLFMDQAALDEEHLDQLDRVTDKSIRTMLSNTNLSQPQLLEIAVSSAIFSYRQAIISSSHNVHAQAVAWYNLGWMETRGLRQATDVQFSTLKRDRLARASVRCFKCAIELEAGNADFWNALGVSTTTLNPEIAQHSFVRSLHLNERSARTWTNLGVLYLIHGDHELAHDSFARAQSTDPDYAYAWAGEGLIATHLSQPHEALSHFRHASDIANDAASLVKSRYSIAAFDDIPSSPRGPVSASDLVQPIFVLRQVGTQTATDTGYMHLLALLQERVGDLNSAVDNMTKVASHAETRYEETEEDSYLGQFARAKADLARVCIASERYEAAIEHAETALDLTSEATSGDLDQEERQRLRLSAHVSAGLAHYFLDAFDESISMFQEALSESDDSADVVCQLAQVLWAKGGEKKKSVARDQLFECIEKHPGHAQATNLIGAMSAIDNDGETLSAVIEDMQTLRTNEKLTTRQRRQLEGLLGAISRLSSNKEDGLQETKVSIMTAPEQVDGWSSLADICTDDEVSKANATEMAVLGGMQAVANGTFDAVQMSQTLAAKDVSGDSQRAIVLSPWLAAGWEGVSAG